MAGLLRAFEAVQPVLSDVRYMFRRPLALWEEEVFPIVVIPNENAHRPNQLTQKTARMVAYETLLRARELAL